MTEEKADGYPWLTLRSLLTIIVMGLYMVGIWGWTAWDYVEVVFCYTGSYLIGRSLGMLQFRGRKALWEYWLILVNTALTTVKKLFCM